ncbi:hypothetical protein AB3S75_033325 [Citrus x aurantiifolia]
MPEEQKVSSTFIRSQMGKGKQGVALVSGACPESVLNKGALSADALFPVLAITGLSGLVGECLSFTALSFHVSRALALASTTPRLSDRITDAIFALGVRQELVISGLVSIVGMVSMVGSKRARRLVEQFLFLESSSARVPYLLSDECPIGKSIDKRNDISNRRSKHARIALIRARCVAFLHSTLVRQAMLNRNLFHALVLSKLLPSGLSRRKEDNLSSKMDGIQGELKNRPVAHRSIPKSLATASSALQSQDPMVKKRIDDVVALFYVECSIGRLDCSKIKDGKKGVSDDATRDNRSSKEHRLRPKLKGSEHESSLEKRS